MAPSLCRAAATQTTGNDTGATPVVLGDYSDRPGDATWILKALMDEGVSNMMYAALRDEHALATLSATKAKPGDAFDMSVGGFTGEQAGSLFASKEPLNILARVGVTTRSQ